MKTKVLIEPDYDLWSLIFLCFTVFLLGVGYYISYKAFWDFLGYTHNFYDTTKKFYFWILIMFFSTNILLITVIYFNELISIDVDKKEITFKKLFRPKETFSFTEIDGYVIEKQTGKGGKYIYYFIKDNYVICRFNDITTTNWEEIKKGFEDIGYKKITYKGSILLNCLIGSKIKIIS
jgi:hypothetical protein